MGVSGVPGKQFALNIQADSCLANPEQKDGIKLTVERDLPTSMQLKLGCVRLSWNRWD